VCVCEVFVTRNLGSCAGFHWEHWGAQKALGWKSDGGVSLPGIGALGTDQKGLESSVCHD
jgi:hypothetical protein